MSAGARGLDRAYALTAGIAVAIALAYAFQPLYPSEIGRLSGVFTVLAAGAAFVAALFTLRKYWSGGRGPFPFVWLGFSSGILLWFVGYAVWEYYAVVLGVQVPYPSVADVFFLGGYLPVTVGLAQYVRIFSGAVPQRRAVAIGAVVFVSAFLVSWVIIAPALTGSIGITEKFFDFAYPILDLVMLSLALLGLSVFAKGTVGRSWLLLLVAVFLVAGGDLLYTLLTSAGEYYNGSVDDLFYVLAYITVTLAFYVHTREL